MTGKFFNLLAVSSLAILACSFGPTQVNALSGESHNFARHASPAHDHFIKKRKRAVGKRCRARPPTDPSTTPAADTNPAPAAGTSPSPTPDSGNNGGNGGGYNGNNGGGNSGNNGGGNSGNNGGGQSSDQSSQNNNTPPPQTNNFPPASGGGGGKGGLAWPNGPDASLANFKSDKVSMLYTWSPSIPDNARQLGFNVAPMLWGTNQIDEFVNTVKPGYANHVMGFNEPNQVGQSDINADYGCQLWQQHIAPLKGQGYTLVSPATTSSPTGKVWMQDFFKNGCDADVVALHWYDVSPDAFIAYVQDFHTTFGKRIWVTEFACQNFNGGPQCSKDEVFAFFQKVTQWMEEQDFVEFYFPFGVMHDMQGVNSDNQLMAGDGGLTDLGKMFVHG